MMKRLEAEGFLRDVANHEMTICLDTNLYRHLRFAQPQNSNMWFELMNWPGVLTIHGDMGTWTFSRVQDMFTFFRADNLRINAGYWSEKLQHGTYGGSEGAKVWSDDLFKERLREQLTNYYSLEGEDLATVTEALENEVLNQDNKYDLLIAARDFSCDLRKDIRIPQLAHRDRDRFQFDPCELPDGKEYAYHFIWCLYAIVWGIQQYDARATLSTEALGVNV
jgi:hypothetical protein